MIYAVIDTNVIVSAYITKNLSASTSKVWAAVLQGKITPVYSDEIIDDYSEVLHRKKFGIPENLIKWAIDRIIMNGVHGDWVPSTEYFLDPKDVVFYEVAISKEDTCLVTGNKKHFPNNPIVEPGRIWQHECDGWYIYSNIGNKTKIEDLKRISDYFHLGLKIEEGKPE